MEGDGEMWNLIKTGLDQGTPIPGIKPCVVEEFKNIQVKNTMNIHT